MGVTIARSVFLPNSVCMETHLQETYYAPEPKGPTILAETAHRSWWFSQVGCSQG